MMVLYHSLLARLRAQAATPDDGWYVVALLTLLVVHLGGLQAGS